MTTPAAAANSSAIEAAADDEAATARSPARRNSLRMIQFYGKYTYCNRRVAVSPNKASMIAGGGSSVFGSC